MPQRQTEARVRSGVHSCSTASCNQRSVCHSRSAKHAPVAFNFRCRAERFCIIVGQLYRGPPFDMVNFADQADGIKFAAAFRIAATEIVGQQSSPAGAESNAPARNPLLPILEVGGASEVLGIRTALKRSPEISMQADDVIDVESVRGDDELVVRVPAAFLQ